jgi:hypothetical protein
VGEAAPRQPAGGQVFAAIPFRKAKRAVISSQLLNGHVAGLWASCGEFAKLAWCDLPNLGAPACVRWLSAPVSHAF